VHRHSGRLQGADNARESRSSSKLIGDALKYEKLKSLVRNGKSTVIDKEAVDEQKFRTIWRAFG
jgi:predicted kinase